MAVYLPIITQFNPKGLKEAEKGFKDLEGFQAKAKYAVGRANKYAAVAVGALAVGLGDAVKAAAEDEKAQDLLRKQIERSTDATDAQIKGIEDYITKAGKQKNFTDDKLRPSFGNLVRATQDVEEAQDLMTIAMDIATAKGIPLDTVTKNLEKAYGGNMTALQKLSPELRDMIRDGASLETVMGELSKTFGGAAAEAANTTAGKFETMKIQMNELKEGIGASLLPIVERLLPFLNGMADWASKNPQTFTIIAGAIGAIAISIMAINTAMALNPIGLIIIGVGLLIAALAIAYTKFEGFRKIIDNVFDAIKFYITNVSIPLFKALLSAATTVFQAIAAVWNNTIGKLSFTIPSWVGGVFGGKSFSVPQIGSDGGTTSARAFESLNGISTANAGMNLQAAVSAGGSSPSVGTPMELIAPTGSGTNTMAGGLAGVGGFNGYNVNIEVNGGDPNAVVDALRTYMRQNGSVPIKISNAF